MINHVRTVLMNHGRDGYAHTHPGEEYVPALFHPKVLPSPLSLAYQVLFGTATDRTFLNYRMWQVMNLLHSTELESHVYRLDPRVTYWPSRRTDFFDKMFYHESEQVAGPEACPITVGGFHHADEGAGTCEQGWRLEITSLTSGEELVQVQRLRPPFNIAQVFFDPAMDLSEPVKLGGTGLTVRFRNGPIGTAWVIRSYGRPQSDLSQVMERMIATLGESGIGFIFGDEQTEPLLTYRNIWNAHPLSAYKYSALLLALSYRFEQVQGK